ncbi:MULTISPECIES: hypothetical protein [unclassified Bradyrhizobium]|uniref:hypothetical protein n=1 Tax=unclassified Bradyrhizobium TaxID=2631580 RepID=UPI00247A0A3F|nr:MULTISPECIES: hypothetical protein [unclassified Bradyrhizobium]WGS18642.1 hypothetical protein MTX22_29395 [Bradyrhizobium sp. ISRA463]WGS25465.1 hypothetical protein MTX19_26975 [Bradyrhizobium sp. ISRA464]
MRRQSGAVHKRFDRLLNLEIRERPGDTRVDGRADFGDTDNVVVLGVSAGMQDLEKNLAIVTMDLFDYHSEDQGSAFHPE